MKSLSAASHISPIVVAPIESTDTIIDPSTLDTLYFLIKIILRLPICSITLYITISVLKLFSSILFFIKSIIFRIVLDHCPYCTIIDINLVCEKGSDILTYTITNPNKERNFTRVLIFSLIAVYMQ